MMGDEKTDKEQERKRPREVRIWHLCLVVSLAAALISPVVLHHLLPNIGTDLCTSVWELVAIGLSFILTRLYSDSIFKGCNPSGEYLGWPGAGNLLRFMRYSKIFLWLAVVAVVVHTAFKLHWLDSQCLIFMPAVLVVSLFFATLCYFVFDNRARSAASKRSKELESSPYPGVRLYREVLSGKAQIHYRSNNYANIPTMLGLSALFLYLLAHYTVDYGQLDLAVFVGGAAAMHVVYGNIVVGVIMANEGLED